MKKATILIFLFIVMVIITNVSVLILETLALLPLNLLLIVFFWQIFKLVKKHEQELTIQQASYETIIINTKKDSLRNATNMIMLVNNIPTPIVYINENGILEIMNPGFCRFIKDYSEKNNYRYNDSQLYVDVNYFLKKAFENNVNMIMRLKVEDIVYQASAINLINEDKAVGKLVIFQDISRAVNDERLQRQFIADASHELKTPISVLKGMLEILNRPVFNDEKVKANFLIQMAKETERLELLVKNLMEVSKYSAEELVLSKQEVDLRFTIDAVIKSLASLYDDEKLTIINEFNYEKLILADADKLYIVFNNILLNAIQYTEKGYIKITSKEQDQYLIIEIEDTGIGMSKDTMQNIFKRFYRVDKSRSRNSGGTGLGLAIVKSIIDAHNGEITVNSKAKKGTTFSIKLIKS